jgi:hydrogenase/urease accessory protein HupE
MTRVRGFLSGVWEFVVGDDWRTALGVVLALGLTALLAETTVAAWWVMPLAVLGLLALSIRRAVRRGLTRGM